MKRYFMLILGLLSGATAFAADVPAALLKPGLGLELPKYGAKHELHGSVVKADITYYLVYQIPQFGAREYFVFKQAAGKQPALVGNGSSMEIKGNRAVPEELKFLVADVQMDRDIQLRSKPTLNARGGASAMTTYTKNVEERARKGELDKYDRQAAVKHGVLDP